jgi:hypothetical protein
MLIYVYIDNGLKNESSMVYYYPAKENGRIVFLARISFNTRAVIRSRTIYEST